MPGLRDRTPSRYSQPSSPIVGVSVGISTAVVLATTTVHIAQRHTPKPIRSDDNLTAQIPLPTRIITETSQASAAQIAPRPTDTAPVLPLLSQKSAFEKARDFGWQAALKSQNSQNTSKRWAESALLWQQAIYFLERVPQSDPNFLAAQEKQATYESNLQQVMTRQIAALTAEANSGQVTTAQATQENNQIAQVAIEEDWIAIAKQQGWQAAIAAQNAPHPAEKWADISRLWQSALQTLGKVEPQSPQYAEAEAIKAKYKENLAAIRERYQIEQSTNQTLRSLQATLREIERSSPVATSGKRAQLVAIIERLRAIPLGTIAHARAQTLIETTTAALSDLPAEPIPRLAVVNEAASEAASEADSQ